MYKEILEVLEMGIKDDGKSFYSDEEKAEMLYKIFNEENKKSFDRGWDVGYERGTRDTKTPSGW
jgi:hypothetical protein